jgi:hypothetical protein
MRSAFAVEADEGLVLTVAMQLVVIAGIGIVTQLWSLRVFITTVRFLVVCATSMGLMISIPAVSP